MDREIGVYVNQEDGQRYTVVERANEVRISPLSGRSSARKGHVEYITLCGKDLNARDDNLECFELIQSGDIICKEHP